MNGAAFPTAPVVSYEESCKALLRRNSELEETIEFLRESGRRSAETIEELRRQIDSLLASRAVRSGDTPKAKRAIALPRSGHRLAILMGIALNAGQPVMPDEFEAGITYGKCPWKRLSELHRMGLVARTDYGAYYLTAVGRAHLASVEGKS